MENKQEAKYIERIEIKGLWGRYDVDWKLNPDVNILVGENGTGKSNILAILNIIVGHVLNYKKEIICNKVVLELTNTVPLQYTEFDSVYSEIPDFGYIPRELEKNEKKIGSLNVNFINTFDSPLSVSDLDRKYNQTLITELDFQLDKIFNNYINFQLNQSKKIINQKQNPEKVFEKQKYLIAVLNKLLSKTEKVVDENENKIAFILENNEKIDATKLSSGEKQLLIILLTVLCQDEKPSILLMDEPEISLHLRWQYELIEIIRTLNPNCQVIIATHSPSIFNQGWRDKIFWIDDIVKKKEVVHG
jgi:predicted ATPase